MTKRPHFNEFSLIYDEFVVFNKAQVSLFKSNLKKFSKKNINFLSHDSNIFNEYKNKYSYNLPNTVKSVMILELQLWCDDVRFEFQKTMIFMNFILFMYNFKLIGYRIFF